ncbi:conserved hypothetical protein [Methanospirillum hungatei JF-1]|nr:conserved hypothetical protein [Methanospirillum hungatei JF-1]
MSDKMVASGSSPYTRGTLPKECPHLISFRFIPIHTGNSTADSQHSTSFTVHPHTHGELQFFRIKHGFEFGSSPYTRGTRVIFLLIDSEFRFIPIHTGNSGTSGP